MMADGYPTLRSVVLDTPDPRRLAEFYRQLAGYEYRPGDEPPPPGEPDPKGEDWVVLIDPAGRARLAFQAAPNLPRSTWPDSQVPMQLHLDFGLATKDELARQHQRTLGLGATVLEDRFDDPVEPLYVYADPAGHPFCLFVVVDP